MLRPDGTGVIELQEGDALDSYATFAWDITEDTGALVIIWEHEYVRAENEAAVDVWEIGDEPHTTTPRLDGDRLEIDLGLELPTDFRRHGSPDDATAHELADLGLGTGKRR
ncbi:MAG: hypothetical protein AAGD38_04550 [Acidobacteriota bacterium]